MKILTVAGGGLRLHGVDVITGGVRTLFSPLTGGQAGREAGAPGWTLLIRLAPV